MTVGLCVFQTCFIWHLAIQLCGNVTIIIFLSFLELCRKWNLITANQLKAIWIKALGMEYQFCDYLEVESNHIPQHFPPIFPKHYPSQSLDQCLIRDHTPRPGSPFEQPSRAWLLKERERSRETGGIESHWERESQSEKGRETASCLFQFRESRWEVIFYSSWGGTSHLLAQMPNEYGSRAVLSPH